MLIIFGTKNVRKTIKRGNFNCPRCNTQRIINLNQNKNYFSLFSIPVIPLRNNGDTLCCNVCKTEYIPNSILDETQYIASTRDIDGKDFAIVAPGKRLLDLILNLTFLILLNFPLAYLADYLPPYFNNKFAWVFLSFWCIYFFIMKLLFKGTIGKKIVGIETISASEGKKISVFKYFIRSIVKVIPFINVVLLFNDKKKACNDFIANTIVKEN
ncbi:zinc-ribbon domain-containing protein [Paenimyroides tangerinum]|uniref:Zinc-ribbon domain-containing protein n=1 Tax=Paenimyroides tangerinum TaxID=2488728 RepID=A0A3P3VXK2_9FLAO|nr:RDD family protein [Paenimyroides tangerinum]RRJ87420.1 zinc-ribbon domain-containing protein [Paenimyroides tangerinum]